MPTNSESSTHHHESKPHTHAKKPRDIRMAAAVGIFILLAVLYYFRGLFIVGTVNGQPISRLSLMKELNEKYGQKTADTLVNRALIMQEAQRQHITVSDKEVNDETKKVEDTLKAQGQKLDTVLELQGMSRTTFREQMRLQKIIEKLLGKSVTVSDEEVNKYIEENKLVLDGGPTDKQVKDNVRETLKQQKLNDKFQSWLTDLRKKAKIDYWTSF